MATIDEALNDGWQLHQAHKFAEAEQVYRQVLAAAPQSASAWCYLGMVLYDQERQNEALAAFERATALAPTMAVAWQNFGKALGRLRRFDEAIECFDRAIALSPGYLNAYKNKARAVFFQGDLAATESLYRLILRLDPTDVETHMNLGMLRLQHGDAAAGWPEYEWRWKSKDGALAPLAQPLWRGEDLAGKSILLTPEQGLGDSIQFIRYAAVLNQRYACRVLFHCPRSLAPLLSSCAGIDQLIAGDAPPPPTDFFAPLLQVPAMLGHAPQDFPGGGAYLAADRALVAAWRERLAGYPGLKVGIAWRGSPKHPADRMRSIPLAEFAPLATVNGVQLFSLQKGPGSDELPPLAERLRIVDLGSRLDESTGAFVETAAVLKNLDLLIACDTAIVHVAGALCARVWLVLNNAPDWRWLVERDDSPAYPSFRLFRQTKFGDWPGVFGRLADVLRGLARAPRT